MKDTKNDFVCQRVSATICGIDVWGPAGKWAALPKSSILGVDEEGVPTTDPHKAKYLMPMAGPKGYGLALIFDILSGPLTGALFGKRLPLMYGDYEKHCELGAFHWRH